MFLNSQQDFLLCPLNLPWIVLKGLQLRVSHGWTLNVFLCVCTHTHSKRILTNARDKSQALSCIFWYLIRERQFRKWWVTTALHKWAPKEAEQASLSNEEWCSHTSGGESWHSAHGYSDILKPLAVQDHRILLQEQVQLAAPWGLQVRPRHIVRNVPTPPLRPAALHGDSATQVRKKENSWYDPMFICPLTWQKGSDYYTHPLWIQNLLSGCQLPKVMSKYGCADKLFSLSQRALCTCDEARLWQGDTASIRAWQESGREQRENAWGPFHSWEHRGVSLHQSILLSGPKSSAARRGAVLQGMAPANASLAVTDLQQQVAWPNLPRMVSFHADIGWVFKQLWALWVFPPKEYYCQTLRIIERLMLAQH